MLAFEIDIDGKHWVLAGTEDWSLLNFIVTAFRAGENLRGLGGYICVYVGGLSRSDSEKIQYHFRWPEAELVVGSSVTVRVTEVSHAEAPKKRYRSDTEVNEPAFTEEEIRAMRYQDYLELKNLSHRKRISERGVVPRAFRTYLLRSMNLLNFGRGHVLGCLLSGSANIASDWPERAQISHWQC
jgi:hypothetical protein